MYTKFIFDVVLILFEHDQASTTDCTCFARVLEFKQKSAEQIQSSILQTKLVEAPSKHKDEAGCCSDASNALWKEIHNHFYLPKLHALSRVQKNAQNTRKSK